MNADEKIEKSTGRSKITIYRAVRQFGSLSAILPSLISVYPRSPAVEINQPPNPDGRTGWAARMP
ncbi:MAG: hypothetical protein ACXIUM_13860 [Wenzhouxiangella sp.]